MGDQELDKACLPPEPSDAYIGHLSRGSQGLVRYVEPSYWATVLNDVSELDDLLNSEMRHTGRVTAATDSQFSMQNVPLGYTSLYDELAEDDFGHLSRPPAWTQQPHVLAGAHQWSPEVISQLPSKLQCDVLIEAYNSYYHAIVPLIHLSRFATRFERFWLRRGNFQVHTSEDLHFATLLLAVVFAGANVCPVEALQRCFNGQHPKAIVADLRRKASRALRWSNFPRSPSKDTFRAYLICEGIWVREEEPLASCGFIGFCIRIAQILGLHRDPENFDNMDPVEREIRRRTWWHVFQLDVSIALASGLPPMVDNTSWSVREVSEVKEVIFGTKEAEEYEEAVRLGARERDIADHATDPNSGSSFVSTVGILTRGKFRQSFVARKITDRLHQKQSMSNDDVATILGWIESLEAELIKMALRIPMNAEELMLRSPSEPVTGNGVTFKYKTTLTKWARLMLGVLSQACWCIISSAAVRDSVGSAWRSLYPRVLRHCSAFLQRVIYMTCLEDDFEGLHWCWPGNHQPLNAILVVLKDLDMMPNSPRAARQRNLIEQTFSLCDPHGGLIGGASGPQSRRPVSEGGVEAWKLLLNLRARAWRKAGLDANVFWTREQGVQAARDEFTREFNFTRAGEVASGEALNRTAVLIDPEIDPSFEVPGDEYMSDAQWAAWDNAFLGQNILNTGTQYEY